MAFIKQAAHVVGRISKAMFGRVSWSAPVWLRASINQFQKRPLVSIATSVLIIGTMLATAYFYYQWLNRPVPPALYATVELSNPFSDQSNERFSDAVSNTDVTPAPAFIHFDYLAHDASNSIHNTDAAMEARTNEITPLYRRPTRDDMPSVASLAALNKPSLGNINITPYIKGVWKWLDQNTLSFVPEKHWQAGVDYEVELPSNIFADDVHLASNVVTIEAEPLSVNISSFEFYQDPSDPRNKHLVASVNSNYPIDEANLLDYLSLTQLSSQDASQSVASDVDIAFTLSAQSHHTQHFLKSERLSLPEQSKFAQLSLAKGLKSQIGGQAVKAVLQSKTIIPDIYSLFEVNQVKTDIVYNDQREPSQVLMIEFTDAISQTMLKQHLQLYKLPSRKMNGARNNWQNPNAINDRLLEELETLPYTILNAHLDANTTHTLKVDTADDAKLYLRLSANAASVNGYIKPTKFHTILSAPQVPKSLFFAEEGMLIASAHKPSLGIGSYGLDALTVEVGRLKRSQLVHLISQARGDLSNLDFKNWSFDEYNLANLTARKLPLLNASNSRLNRAQLNLSEFTKDRPNGVFIVKAQGLSSSNDRIVYGAEAKRAVLITDIGILLKHDKHQTLDVFLQSLSSGKPIGQATVTLLTASGEVLDSSISSTQGRASFNVMRNHLKGRQPHVVLVEKQGDLSFIPYQQYSHIVDYSRMDSGGVSTYWGDTNLPVSFVFSDRGIYRPGEDIKIGAMIKAADLSLANRVNVELVLRNPQYQIVESTVFTVSQQNLGFFEHTFNTQPSFASGQYTASVHLKTDTQGISQQGQGRRLGSVPIQVNAFEADKLSLNVKLKQAQSIEKNDKKPTQDLDENPKGWLNQNSIISDILVENLYGAPSPNNSLDINYRFIPAQFVLDGYDDFIFSLPKRANTTLQRETIEKNVEAQTLPNGQFTYQIDTSVLDRGLYRLMVNVKAFEGDSGKYVDTQQSQLFSHQPALLGYRALFNPTFVRQEQSALLELINLNNRLKPNVRKNLTVVLSRANTISSLIALPDGKLAYEDQTQWLEISKQAYELDNQVTSYQLDTMLVGDYQLQVLDSEEAELLTFKYSVVGDGKRIVARDSSNPLRIKLDKADYKPGETINISIDAPYQGHGLITIESDKVNAHKWFSADSLNTVVSIMLPEDLEGGAYINVSLVRDLAAKEVQLPAFTYALAPFSIDRSRRVIDLSIKAPAVINPEQSNTVDVDLPNPAKVLIFAVDEGILQVAGYQAPDPLAYFLQKKALGVDSFQMLDMLLPDINLTFYASAPGGAEIQAEAMMMRSKLQDVAQSINPFAQKIEDPAVYWSGIQDGKKGLNTFSFDMPDSFDGKLRIFAIALDEQGAGISETTTFVRSDFVIDTVIPSHTGPNDTIETTITVRPFFDFDEDKQGAKNIHVSISHSQHITLLSSPDKSLQPKADGTYVLPLSYVASDKLGQGSIVIQATATDIAGKRRQSSKEIMLSNRPHTLAINTWSFGILNKDIELVFPETFSPELAVRTLGISHKPATFNATLKQWVEAQSSNLAQRSTSQQLSALQTMMALPAQTKQSMSDIQTAFETVKLNQTNTGGFGLTAPNQHADIALSLKALSVFQMARSKGVLIDNGTFNLSVAFANKIAQQNIQSNVYQRAQAIYLLSRQGEVTTNYLIDIESEIKNPKRESGGNGNVVNSDVKPVIDSSLHEWRLFEAKLYLAASYQSMLQTQKVNEKLADIEWNMSASSVEQLRAKLNAFSLYVSHFSKPVGLSKENSAGLFSDLSKHAMTTMLAGDLAHYFALVADQHRDTISELSVNVQSVSEASSSRETLAPSKTATDMNSYSLQPSTTNVWISISDIGIPTYYQLQQRGYPKQAENLEQGIEILKTLVDADGNKLSQDQEGRHLMSVSDTVTVKISLRTINGKAYQAIDFVDLIPAGFAPIQNSLTQSSDRRGISTPPQFIGSDRIATTVDVSPTLTTIEYQMSAITQGLVTLPVATVQHQFDANVMARGQLGRILVGAKQ